MKEKLFTISVEGNIGAGKSTFIEQFQNMTNITIFQEPIDNWQNIEGYNILKLLYENPLKYQTLFQFYVLLSFFEHQISNSAPIKLIERSLYSAYFVFFKRKNINKNSLEYIVLDKWFNFMINNCIDKLHMIIYLRTDPEIAFKRMKARNRDEEKNITLEYIKNIHDLHENWLNKEIHTSMHIPVLVIDANKEFKELDLEIQFVKFYMNMILNQK
jgi:deoxyadenosine/deoxycytidine kinase